VSAVAVQSFVCQGKHVATKIGTQIGLCSIVNVYVFVDGCHNNYNNKYNKYNNKFVGVKLS